MASNVLILRWNRVMPTCERQAAQTFREFSEYLAARQKAGEIESYEAVLLEPHGGDTGFFMIRGSSSKLHELTASSDWMRYQATTMHILDGVALLRGVTGQALHERMQIWMAQVPR